MEECGKPVRMQLEKLEPCFTREGDKKVASFLSFLFLCKENEKNSFSIPLTLQKKTSLFFSAFVGLEADSSALITPPACAYRYLRMD